MAQAQTYHNTYRIPAPTDLALVELFGQLAALGEDTEIRVWVAGVGLPSFKTAAEFRSHFPEADWATSARINQAHANVPGGFVEFFRSVARFDPHGGAVVGRDASAFEADIWIRPSSDPAGLIALTSVIEAFRKPQKLARGVGGANSQVELLAQQVTALGSLSSAIVHDAHDARVKQDQELEDLRKQLVAKFEEKHRDLEEELALGHAELAEAEKRLKAREDALDDRQHTHYRRHLREQITTNLKGRLDDPKPSGSVRQQRRLIATGGMVLAAIAAAIALVSVIEFAREAARIGPNLFTYLLVARTTLSLAAAGGLGMYLLGWARQMHDRDLQNERDLERYRYDIDRATWAIETILEVQSKDGAGERFDVPDQWIAGVTHELFARGPSQPEDNPARDFLALLANSAAEAEIGASGTKIRVGARGMRKLGKEAQED